MKKVLIAIFVIASFQMCGLKKNDGLKVEMNPEIESGLNKYKNQLGTEKIIVNLEYSSIYDDRMYFAHVLIFYPKNLTKDEAENIDLALEIASLVYRNIVNKNAFSKIEIKFIYAPTFRADYYDNRSHTFSYEQIENCNPKLE